MMNLRPLILLAVGFGLLALSNSLELRGDMAPFAESGVSTERATWHIAGLLAVVAALGCFVAALRGFWRNLRG